MHAPALIMSLQKVEGILKHIADVEGFKNYEVHPDENTLRGDGFSSEFYTGHVKNKDTDLVIDAYIKNMPINPGPVGTSSFFNETKFYATIWPQLDKFQNEKGIKTAFKHIPRFFCAGNKPGDEYICLEDLRIQNFEMWDKTQVVNENILKMIFDRYGKFHGLSFAFKDQNYEKYTELTNSLKDVYCDLAENDSFLSPLRKSFSAAYNALKEIDEVKAKRIKSSVENIDEKYRSIVKYDGQFSGLVHGDCWSNNILYKFRDDGTVDDIKFIDFQLCRNSTPIHDLSYFFYSGASREDFKKLDEYLALYYKSFSDFAKELGSDPEKLLPFNDLKSEWKKYSLLGIFMGIIVWTVKLMEKSDIEDITATEDGRKGFEKGINSMLQTDTFKTNTSDILLHALEYGIL